MLISPLFGANQKMGITQGIFQRSKSEFTNRTLQYRRRGSRPPRNWSSPYTVRCYCTWNTLHLSGISRRFYNPAESYEHPSANAARSSSAIFTKLPRSRTYTQYHTTTGDKRSNPCTLEISEIPSPNHSTFQYMKSYKDQCPCTENLIRNTSWLRRTHWKLSSTISISP